MLEEALAPRGITLTQYSILSMVSTTGGMSSADVARRSNVSKQATNQVINALERLGFIERREDPANRRIQRIRLTARGRRILASCDRAVDRGERAFFAALSPARLASLRRTIEILIARGESRPLT
jgi:DNA-binding MarR family transcriptional regulator